VNGFVDGAGIRLNAPGSFVDHVWSGVDATGTTAAPNQIGIRAESDGNTILNSLLSGNTLAGIQVLNADDNNITNNLIGTDLSGTVALANGGDGVELRSANGATVTGNVIAFNGEDGVLVVDTSTGNTISNNSIFSNTQLGIDLGNDGVTANDNLDADAGANDLTNAPVLTGAAAVPIPAHLLFHDTFDDGGSSSIDDPSARATGLLADLVKYKITNADAGEVAVTNGLLDWTGTNIANGNLETANGSQKWTFRTGEGGNTHFDWAPYLAGDIFEVSFTYRSAWSQPLTFGVSDSPQPGNWNADEHGSYDYAFGAWGRNWDSGDDGNTTRMSGADGDTEFDVLLKINEPAGTAEAWVDGTLISTELIDFENTGRYFSFGENLGYGGYIDNFKVFVMPTRTTTTIVGAMNGLANTEYTLELFSNAQHDSTGHGEGQTLVYTMTATTDSSGTAPFSFDLTTLAPGTFITATATDPSGNTSEFSVAAEVKVNQPPVLGSIGNRTIDEGVELGFTATASDPDTPANTLTFSLDAGAPAGASIDPISGVFNWTPSETQGPGTHDITVRVFDNGAPAEQAFETIEITVGEVNRAPEFATLKNVSVFVGKPVSLVVQANDADVPNNKLSYSLGPGSPEGASLDSHSGEFHWTPGYDSPLGVVDITVAVMDDGTPPLSDEQSFQVLVMRPSFSNPRNRFDVDDDGSVGIRDVVAVATYLHSPGIGDVPLNYQPGAYIDVDDNGRAQVFDLALVIGEVHRIFSSGEGEPNRRNSVWFGIEDDEEDFWYSGRTVDTLAADGLDRVTLDSRRNVII
jgi:parallel beta-helix repeat protein